MLQPTPCSRVMMQCACHQSGGMLFKRHVTPKPGNSVYIRDHTGNRKWRRCNASNLEATRAAEGYTLSLQCTGNTFVKLPLRSEQIQSLKKAVSEVIGTFAEKKKAERPRRWDSMECKLIGTSRPWIRTYEV